MVEATLHVRHPEQQLGRNIVAGRRHRRMHVSDRIEGIERGRGMKTKGEPDVLEKQQKARHGALV